MSGDHGEPIKDASSEAIDVWSRNVFEAFLDWPLARDGCWFQTDEGYLRLRIEKIDREALEPLSVIELEISEKRILVDLGSWATPISAHEKPTDWGAGDAAAEARYLVEGWLKGPIKLASYSDANGWRGSKIIEGLGLPEAIEPVPVEIGEDAEVIVKTFRRSDWRSWFRTPDRQWVEREVRL